jgi:hypothetical protein
MKMHEARSYVKRIRNPEKRRYAQAYLAYLTGGPKPDTADYRLSYMGAQAVRLDFAAMNRRKAS